MSIRALQLWGRHYSELGSISVVRLARDGALALTRGAEPKAYPHVDPNEDAALLVETEDGVLLAVADGNGGRRASEVTLAEVQRIAAELIPLQGQAFEKRCDAMVRAIAKKTRRLRPSKTCLTLATLHQHRWSYANFGDSTLFRSSTLEPLAPMNDFSIGPNLALRVLPPELWAGFFDAKPGERIAVVSDGMTNFVEDLSEIQSILRDADDDATAAHDLVETAMAAGAGDNVAVAVLKN